MEIEPVLPKSIVAPNMYAYVSQSRECRGSVDPKIVDIFRNKFQAHRSSNPIRMFDPFLNGQHARNAAQRKPESSPLVGDEEGASIAAPATKRQKM